MSIERMSTVWKHSQHKGSALLLLLAIADNADDNGYCWPGIEYLAKKIKMTPQSVIRLTKELEESKELFVYRSRRHGNKYVVRLGITDKMLTIILIEKFNFDSEIISNILLHNTYVTSEVTPDVSSEVTPVLDESSVSVNESSHVAGATPSPRTDEAVGDDLLDQFGLTKQERDPQPETPHWTTRIDDEWTQWGNGSEEMQRQLTAYGERGRTVQRIGHELEQQFGLRPLWNDPKAVNGWMSGIAICLDEADNDEILIFKAARKLIKAEMSVSSPWSLRKEIRAIASRMRVDDNKAPEPYSDEWYKQQMENDIQTKAFK